MAHELPTPFLEPMIPTGVTVAKVAAARAVIALLDAGTFFEPANMVEQMLWNPRLRGVVETRLNGLMGTAIRWEPARQNDAARRAARAAEEDWPLIADEPTRKQLHQWGLILGLGLAQLNWYTSPMSLRAIPRLQVYHPQWSMWDWVKRKYLIQTYEGKNLYIPSPSLETVTDESQPPLWVVHEPFGQHSWRWGLIHSAWYAWLGHEWSCRDQSRASEKLGIGIIKAKYPHGVDADGTKKFIAGIRSVNSEGVIPCEEFEDGKKFDAEAMEFSGVGGDLIQRTKDSKAVDLAVLFLGHNLTTEAKGGSYAAANVGDLIRGDIKAFDAAAEWTTIRRQVLMPWAKENFGDAELAPIAVYETDPPAINQQAAQTLQLLSQAASVLAKFPAVDLQTMFARFRVPQIPGVEPGMKEPPAPAKPPAAAPAAAPAPAPPAAKSEQEKMADEAMQLSTVAEAMVNLRRAGVDLDAARLREFGLSVKEAT